MTIRNFIINPAEDTPSVKFDSTSGKFSISGMSRPEDVTKIYNPMIEWLKNYSTSPASLTKVDFKYAYFNTASARKIYELLAVFDNINKSGKSKVEINWYYDEPDIDMKMVGEEYDDLIDISINHIVVSMD